MSRATRHLTIGLAATALTAGLAAAPATAQDLPENSSGSSTSNGWTPEGSVGGWAELSGRLAAQGLTNPEQAIQSSAMFPQIVIFGSVFGGAPLFPYCGVFNTSPGCSGGTTAD